MSYGDELVDAFAGCEYQWGGDESAAVTYDAGSTVTERHVAAVPEEKTQVNAAILTFHIGRVHSTK